MLEPVASTDFRSQVAELYRSRGYTVRENCRVRGQSERIYAVDLVAQGPLGNLLVSFGDAGGVDAMEIGRVRQVAKDIGATPVMAAPDLDLDMRQLAAQMAVVVMDEAAVRAPGEGVPMIGGRPRREEMFDHPWPKSGRAENDADDEPATPEAPSGKDDPGAASWPSGDIVKDVSPTGSDKFSWLSPPKAKPETAPASTPVEGAPVQGHPVVHSAPGTALPTTPATRTPTPAPATAATSQTTPPATQANDAVNSTPAGRFEVVEELDDSLEFITPATSSARAPPVARPASASNRLDPLAGLDDVLEGRPGRARESSHHEEPVTAGAPPAEPAPIEVEETLLARKASAMERVQQMDNRRLLWIVLGGIVAATAVYVGILIGG